MVDTALGEISRTDSAARVPLGASRGRVLAALQDAAVPTSVEEVAERVQLHPNTTRFHLDALVDAGLAERASEQRAQPGRPRMMYAALPDAVHTGERSYRLLAQILASYLAAAVPRAGEAARRAGETWGRYLAERPAPFERIDAAGATRQLVATFDSIGFAPEAKTVGRRRQLLLHHCPFREVAERNQDVVCALHLGLMQGMLDEIDAPLDATRLDPLVQPSLCVTHLATKADRKGDRRGRPRR